MIRERHLERLMSGGASGIATVTGMGRKTGERRLNEQRN